LPHEASADNLKLATGSHERRRDTGAELDVVDVKVDVEADGYVVLRMTWRQHKAYLHGSFTPGYPGELQNMGLDEDGNVFETIDVTDQRY
jgi:hypothetical protein